MYFDPQFEQLKYLKSMNLGSKLKFLSVSMHIVHKRILFELKMNLNLF